MIANGVLRVVVLQPILGEDLARQVASITGGLVILALSGVFVRLSGPMSPGALLRIGAVWLTLTLAFELLFGRYVSGLSWDAILADYDLSKGRLWPLVLAVTFASPWLWGQVFSRRRASPSGK